MPINFVTVLLELVWTLRHSLVSDYCWDKNIDCQRTGYVSSEVNIESSQGRVNEQLFQNCWNGNIFCVGVTGDPLGHCYKVTKTLRRMERCSALSEIFKCVHIVINIFQPNLRFMSHRNGTCEEIRELNDCLKDC